jgi:hypothetical protein
MQEIAMTDSSWGDRFNQILLMLERGDSLAHIGRHFGVSRERIRQVIVKNELLEKSPQYQRKRRRISEARKLGPKRNWIYSRLVGKGVGPATAFEIAKSIHAPDCCPVFGVPLEYGASGYSPNGASIDRIDSSLAYGDGNLQIISRRANTIKNDATPDELRRLADYMARQEAGLKSIPVFAWMTAA